MGVFDKSMWVEGTFYRPIWCPSQIRASRLYVLTTGNPVAPWPTLYCFN